MAARTAHPRLALLARGMHAPASRTCTSVWLWRWAKEGTREAPSAPVPHYRVDTPWDMGLEPGSKHCRDVGRNNSSAAASASLHPCPADLVPALESYSTEITRRPQPPSSHVLSTGYLSGRRHTESIRRPQVTERGMIVRNRRPDRPVPFLRAVRDRQAAKQGRQHALLVHRQSVSQSSTDARVN